MRIWSLWLKCLTEQSHLLDYFRFIHASSSNQIVFNATPDCTHIQLFLVMSRTIQIFSSSQTNVILPCMIWILTSLRWLTIRGQLEFTSYNLNCQIQHWPCPVCLSVNRQQLERNVFGMCLFLTVTICKYLRIIFVIFLSEPTSAVPQIQTKFYSIIRKL